MDQEQYQQQLDKEEQEQLNAERKAKEEIALWKSLAITKELYAGLREERQVYVDMLSTGESLTGDPGKTAEKTAELVGMIKGIDLILNVQYEAGGVTYGLPD